VLAGRALALVHVHLAALAREAGRAGACVVGPQVGAGPAVGAGGAPALVHLHLTGGALQPGAARAREVCP
jgi:hypothetical protein